MTKFVVVCLSVTVVAIVAVVAMVVVSGPEQVPRFSTISSAIEDGAEVLAADKDGAVTMTANGRVRGFSRSGEQLWERKFDRYEPDKRVLLDARATCTTKCPAALLELPTGYQSAGGADPTRYLVNTLNVGGNQLLAANFSGELFTRASPNIGATLRIVKVRGSRALKPSLVHDVGVPNPGYVGIAATGGRGVVGSLIGKPGDKSARIQAVAGNDGWWHLVGPAIPDIESANPCISADGKRIAIVSDRLRVGRFGSTPDQTFGPAISRGSCSIDDKGVSAVMLPRDPTRGLIAARYDFNGRELWNRELGAVRVVSDSDTKFFVVRNESTKMTSMFDVVDGRRVLDEELPANLYAADDGSVVVADRSGTPTWVSAQSP